MKLTPQFTIYITGGVASAIVDIGMMQLLIHIGIDPIIAASGGFFVGLLANYAFHAKVTFRAVTSLSSFSRYIFVVAINYVLTIAFVSVSLMLLDTALIGKIASLPAVAVSGFFLGRYWIFR